MEEESTRKKLFREAKEKGYSIPVNYTNDQIQAVLDGTAPPPPEGSRRRSKRRVPLGTLRSKLSVDGYDIPKDKKARWVNDKPGRLMAAEAGGYEFVDDPEIVVGDEPLDGRDRTSGKVCRHVGPGEDGKPMKAYLMVIDKELWEEDQAEKQRHVDEVDEAIKGGKFGEKPGENRYIPQGGIKIESNSS